MNEYYKIIALFGEAGAGKDYILHQIMKTNRGKENLHQIISCTTRPPREGEKDGVNYHFISLDEFFSFDNMAKWVEFTSFREWWYGTSIDHLVKDKINIGVFNIKGINSLLKDDECQVVPIYIKACDKLRLIRQLNREANPNCQEICRRFQTDKEDFKKIIFPYQIIENNTNEIQPIINEIFDLINKIWS